MEKWTDQEVQALLGIYSDEEIQRELESSSRNAKVYQKISLRLAELGIQHSAQRCREKIKKMKQDYKRIKDSPGSTRRTSKWFECLDAILGAKCAYSAGREMKEVMLDEMNGVKADLDEETSYTEGEQYSEITHPTEPSYDSPATSSSPIAHLPHPTFLRGKRKRDADFLELMREMEENNLEMLRREYEQRERYLQLLLEHDAQEAAVREREFALRQEEAAETRRQQEAFQQGFLSILDRLVQVLDGRNSKTPPKSPPLD
ncbi:zinc finger protein with KRAB and SCAN domains 2 isoform X2 [Trichomycterus rosablanca]|uniref:zinc finger protein with KRAB and SCAN domains 2 isoform X2 n=1 Tax=Trichomycterus rosablanca TaxID=2290929 RepID=UPI002F35AE52